MNGNLLERLNKIKPNTAPAKVLKSVKIPGSILSHTEIIGDALGAFEYYIVDISKRDGVRYWLERGYGVTTNVNEAVTYTLNDIINIGLSEHNLFTKYIRLD